MASRLRGDKFRRKREKMKNLDSSTYTVWRHDLLEIARQAVCQKIKVTVCVHFALDECNTADLTLYGEFLKITGHQAQFLVNGFDLDPGRSFPDFPECDYSFNITVEKKGGGKNKVEYGGRALILDQELGKNGLPTGLLMRLSPPTRARPVRMHARESCPAHLFRLPGLMLAGQEPLHRRHLLNILGHYYQQSSRPKPKLINISAGGVCLETEDPHCLRFMGADERFLFFFFSGDESSILCPNIFVGKKVGLFRDDKDKLTGLRIRFLREMLWTDPFSEVKWLNIESDGSSTIRKILAEGRREPDPK